MDISSIHSILRTHLRYGSKESQLEAIALDLHKREFDQDEFRQLVALHIEAFPQYQLEITGALGKLFESFRMGSIPKDNAIIVGQILEMYRMRFDTKIEAQRIYYEVISSHLGVEKPTIVDEFKVRVGDIGSEKLGEKDTDGRGYPTAFLGKGVLMLSKRFSMNEFWLGPDTYIPDYTILPLRMAIGIQVPSNRMFRDMFFRKKQYDFCITFNASGKPSHKIIDEIRRCNVSTQFFMGPFKREARYLDSLRVDISVQKPHRISKEEHQEYVASLVEKLQDYIREAQSPHYWTIVSSFVRRKRYLSPREIFTPVLPSGITIKGLDG